MRQELQRAVLLCLGVEMLACSAQEERLPQDSEDTTSSTATTDSGEPSSSETLGSFTDDSLWNTESDPTGGCTMMDILFVIDDSVSMGCEQDMLVTAFPEFIDVLETFSSDNADKIAYRVGVTSSGRSVSGKFNDPRLPGAAGDMELPFNEKGLDGAMRAPVAGKPPWIDGPGDQAALAAAFSAMAGLGTEGPNYEMPLQSLRLALEKTATGGVNEGFLREGALFVAVLITDEDDCSRTDNDFTIANDDCNEKNPPYEHNLVPVDEFKTSLDEQFGERGYVFVTIAGQSGCGASSYPTVCEEDDDDVYAGAKVAPRLKSLTIDLIGTGNGRNGLFSDICTQSLPGALQQALDKMEVACAEFVPK